MREHQKEFDLLDDLIAEDRHDEAAALVRPLADRGVAWAQGCLGSLYMCGMGVELDHIAAEYWLGLAASHGDGLACHNLATHYAVMGQPDLSGHWRQEAGRLGWNLLDIDQQTARLQGS